MILPFITVIFKSGKWWGGWLLPITHLTGFSLRFRGLECGPSCSVKLLPWIPPGMGII